MSFSKRSEETPQSEAIFLTKEVMSTFSGARSITTLFDLDLISSASKIALFIILVK
uniref:Uncharacterized protein n=1 Tax=Meloidogyne enterolobii TaxID=390850 RepID=A0A6V7V3X4_MELEN|nr:unnamed protein product [Meloidogyne enterolobii]